MKNEAIVGIDLGTTNSAVACVDEFGRPQVLPNADGKKITPSVVQIREDGSMLVGESAKLEMALEAENTAHFFKRDMGTSTVYHYRGRNYTPVNLSSAVLRQLKADGESALNREVRKAVITVPAYFHDGPRVATKQAAEDAGLNVVQIINEPTAAAVAYGLRQGDHEETVLVYDLGGGTFDITLVRISPETLEVIGTDGNHTLGGKDWDDRLLDFLCSEFQQRQGVNPLDDPFTFQELLIRAEQAKKTLSERLTTTVPINCQGRMDRIEVTRAQFESLTVDLLAQTEMLIAKVLEETGYDYSRVNSVLMVGGSTRMSACQELVRRLTGKAPNISVNPDECVALGAAIQATQYEAVGGGLQYRPNKAKSGGLGFRPVQDVMSHSMGMVAVSADGDRYLNSILISKNQNIPSSEVRPYKVQTRKGAKNTTSVYVTQGENDDLGNCSFVGKYVIDEIPHDDASVVNICFEYDRSGVVTVSATDRKSSQNLSVRKEAVPEDMSWIYRSPKEMAQVAHKIVYLTIDVSGSMSGNPLEEAKKAVQKFVTGSDLTHTSVGLISFSDSAHVVVEATQDGNKLNRGAEKLSIDGGTSEPLTFVHSQLKNQKNPRYCVVLTDGQWSGQERAIKTAKAMQEEGIEIIAVGFGSANVEFLRRIATSDESAFLISSTEIGSAFENIAQELVESSGEPLKLGGGLSFFLRR
ncbi:MAG TPA: Hsp70 family protein [Pyrinomonadaceae bacterium]|nr:Hsp70 family protein [Pyrinomonadaceae bacterium]